MPLRKWRMNMKPNRNTIYNMDCMDVLREMSDGCVDCIVTDPPYPVTPHGNSKKSMINGEWQSNASRKGKIFEDNDIDIADYLPELYRVLRDRAHCYIMVNNLNLTHFLQVIDDSEFNFVKCLIWDKCRQLPSRYYMGCFEYIIFLRKGGEFPIKEFNTPDILKVPVTKTKFGDKTIHYTEKPTSLLEVLIRNSTERGELVLDPFMGSGSTALAAKMCGRDYIGAEINTEYYNNALEKINLFSAQTQLF